MNDDEPKSLRESLDAVTRGLGGPSATALAAVFARWEEVVGAQVAGHAWPRSLRGGVLVIAVDEPIWRTQLTYLESDLLRHLEQVLGTGVVTRIEVRVRPR